MKPIILTLAALLAVPALADSDQQDRRDYTFFAKALSLGSERLHGKKVGGDADCEDTIYLDLVARGLSYGFNSPHWIEGMDLTSSLNDAQSTKNCYIYGSIYGGYAPSNCRGSYWLGKEEGDWGQNSVGFTHYRMPDSFGTSFYVKPELDVSIKDGKVIILQKTQFKDVSGIWAAWTHSVVERVSRRVQLSRLEDGDIWYSVSEASIYKESENEFYPEQGPQPAGKASRTLNCRYRPISKDEAMEIQKQKHPDAKPGVRFRL